MPIGEPNLFAYAALFLWVPVTFVLFSRLRPAEATIWCLLGAVLVLPEQTAIDPPLLPPLDKGSMAAFWCFVACMWKGRKRLKAAKPMRGIDLLFVLVLIGNVGTSLTNQDPIVTGSVVREPLGLYDAFALGVKDILGLYLPFFLGRAMLRTSRDLRDMMRILVICGIAYSVFALIEIRLSPQMHRWFYGFHQMNFSMTMRFGGYRPLVFMLTGMATAMFFLSTAIAATARWRVGAAKPWAAIYLSVVLLACKSTGAIVYGMAVLPVVAFVRKPKMWLPAGLAAMVLLFPLLRGMDVFPTDTLVDAAKNINEERALSLWFRFDQEDQLMERARERMIFGWGMYNRNRVYDRDTGEDLSITDGDWMIQLGTRGLVGFLGLYGLLALAVLRAWRRHARIPSRRIQVLLAAFAMISALITVDLLPNGLFNYLPFFFAGAVEGMSEGIANAADRAKKRRRYERGRRAKEAKVQTRLVPRRSSVPPE